MGTDGHGCVPIKFSLQKQVVGQICPVGCSFLVYTLDSMKSSQSLSFHVYTLRGFTSYCSLPPLLSTSHIDFLVVPGYIAASGHFASVVPFTWNTFPPVSQYLLSTCCVPSAVLNSWDISKGKT